MAAFTFQLLLGSQNHAKILSVGDLWGKVRQLHVTFNRIEPLSVFKWFIDFSLPTGDGLI